MKKTITIAISLSVVLFFIIASCQKKNKTPALYTPTCNGIKSFKTDVLPLIQSKCVSCHNEYSNYSQISSAASSIRSAIVNRSMPKGGSLTDGQKDVIVCWIDAGVTNN
ncbi:MAG: hypothetical protein H0U95_09310 [Bacteroidetes bacterium]|nr:hypothetical protein [Bacteroidota bacterium]